MCRLFFIMNTKNKREKIMDFLSQSTHESKNTPGVNNMYEHTYHPDGFGFTWLLRREWNIYKKPVLYLEDKNLEKLITSMVKSRIIIGHIRNKTYGPASQNNTHPFKYKNQVFFHNGWIKDFGKKKKLFLEKISKKYHSFIKGETDSEHLFYLFLTVKDSVPREPINNDEFMNIVVSNFFQLLKELKVNLLANIIFADEKYIVVSRYSIFDNTFKEREKTPLSLYYDNSDGVVISSEPITSNYKLIPENSILILQH